jgi:hypothetical protein
MKITTIGIDLAKNVFQVHGVDERGKTALKKQVKRDQMAAFSSPIASRRGPLPRFNTVNATLAEEILPPIAQAITQ